MADKERIEQEIQDALGTQTLYDMEKLFPKRSGLGARREVRSRLKLLKQLLPDLSSALIENEKVIYIARGYVMNIWEQLFAGNAVAYYTNITCVILTNCRILLVNTNSAGKQKLFRNQLLYTEIKRIKMSSFLSGASTLKLKDGKSIVITGFRGADRKRMQSYLSELVSNMPKNAPAVEKSLQHLCPHCSSIYTTIMEKCHQCGTTFKSPEKAAIRSLFLPGLGDLYLGHTFFGSLELIGSLFEWIVLISAIADFRAGTDGAKGFLIFWIIVMVLTNVIDYFLTKAMGRKGLIASSKSQASLSSLS